MASEKKHPKSVNRHKPYHDPQNQGTVNVGKVTTGQSLATSKNDTFLQQTSQSHTNGSTHYDTLTSTPLQRSANTNFQYLPRPWTQDDVKPNTCANENGLTPMERWQDESICDQPWHAIEGVYLHDGGDWDMTQQNNNIDNERCDGLAENKDSMACHTSGF